MSVGTAKLERWCICNSYRHSYDISGPSIRLLGRFHNWVAAGRVLVIPTAQQFYDPLGLATVSDLDPPATIFG